MATKKKESEIPFTKEDLKKVPKFISKEVAGDPKKQKAIKQAEAEDAVRPKPKAPAPATFMGKPLTHGAAHYEQERAKAAKNGAAPAKAKMPSNASVKITVLNKANPHQAGSNRANAFNHALKSKTVADFLKGGDFCKAKYLDRWAKDKLIKLGE